ncbi:Protein of unknown function [Bacillus thuringiensis]|nr:Protein of unknown function [Bacillus thuringiensis]
MMTTID